LFQKASIKYSVADSNTPIQVVIIPGNDQVKKMAETLQGHGLDVRAILYPTVPKGKERLRIVFHAFNSEDEVVKLMTLLSE
jgi:8-amino-7-oxononanoate synthase